MIEILLLAFVAYLIGVLVFLGIGTLQLYHHHKKMMEEVDAAVLEYRESLNKLQVALKYLADNK